MKILFWISAFALFYAMVGYPLTLIILDKILKKKIKKIILISQRYLWLYLLITKKKSLRKN